MAHMAKYTRGAVGNMLAHYDRTKEDIPNIDRGLTCQNFNCAELTQPLPQKDFLRQRLSEVHCSRRKDVNVFADWVVTLPQDVPAGDTHDFFRATYDFLKDLYGQKNVISAYVHMDETTPHMHFAFIPVVWDKKHQREKVSAKELLNIRHLRGFHEKLSNYVSERLGYTPSILNGATIEGNKSIEELRRQSATERLEELDDMKEAARLEAKEMLNRTIRNVKAIEESIEGEKKVSEEAYEIRKQYVIDSTKGESKPYPSSIQISEKGFGKNKQRFVTMTEEDWNRVKVNIADVEALRKNHQAMQESISQWQESASARNLMGYATRVGKLESQVEDLKRENKMLGAFKEKYETLKRNIKNVLDMLGFHEAEKKEICNTLGISDAPKTPTRRFGGPRL